MGEAIGRKKDKKTGDSSTLMGYTVGSRAPKGAVSSGTQNKFGYGIGNLYGGKKTPPMPKGYVIKGPSSSRGPPALGYAGVIVFGLLLSYSFAVNGGGAKQLGPAQAVVDLSGETR